MTDPGEGTHKYYTRAGQEYYLNNGALTSQEQVGRVEMVEATDGTTVYIKNIISCAATGMWVKATKSGNKLTVKAGQPVSYDTSYDVTLSVYRGSTPEHENSYVKETDDITFTIDGSTIKLDNSDKFHFIGVFYDDEEDTFTGYANYNTVLTLDEGYTPPAMELVKLPAGAETQTWYFDGILINDNFGEITTMPYSKYDVEVAFVGNDLYLDVFDVYGAWIKGTKGADNIYTFDSFQYLGSSGGMDLFATGADGYLRNNKFQKFQMKYDPEAQTLTSLNYLLANIGDDYIRIAGTQAYTDIVMSKDAPPAADPEAQTGADVDELPYTNALATEKDFAAFGVLDTNEDEKTWAYIDDQFIGSGTCYGYSMYTAGDDWLVSPAIKLEAGKKYRFAIDAKGLYTAGGRFEVKAATGEARATVLAAGKEIIAAKDATPQYVTYENDGLTVSETGYYHFGIHAISKSGYGYLFVANFVVEAAADASAPAAVENFAVTPLSEKIGAKITFGAPTKTIGGENLAAGAIAKIEVLRDGEVITTFQTPAPGTPLAYTDEAASVGTHRYQAVSYGTAGIGGKSEVVEVSLISGNITVPVSFDLTQEGVFKLFTTIDANNDKYGVWEWDSSTGTRYYGSEKAADDYLVSPAIPLEAGSTYTVTVTARSQFASTPERFEVKAGKEATVAGLIQTVIAPTNVANEEFADYTGEFTVTESGSYHIAIHAMSAADGRLYVSSLAVDGPETGIHTIIDAPSTFNVYSLDGRLIRRHATTLSGLKGIYIVNGKKVVL